MIQKIVLFIFYAIFIPISQLPAQRVVIIGLDGFSAEGYKAAKHPNIDKLYKHV